MVRDKGVGVGERDVKVIHSYLLPAPLRIEASAVTPRYGLCLSSSLSLVEGIESEESSWIVPNDLKFMDDSKL